MFHVKLMVVHPQRVRHNQGMNTALRCAQAVDDFTTVKALTKHLLETTKCDDSSTSNQQSTAVACMEGVVCWECAVETM